MPIKSTPDANFNKLYVNLLENSDQAHPNYKPRPNKVPTSKYNSTYFKNLQSTHAEPSKFKQAWKEELRVIIPKFLQNPQKPSKSNSWFTEKTKKNIESTRRESDIPKFDFYYSENDEEYVFLFFTNVAFHGYDQFERVLKDLSKTSIDLTSLPALSNFDEKFIPPSKHEIEAHFIMNAKEIEMFTATQFSHKLAKDTNCRFQHLLNPETGQPIKLPDSNEQILTVIGPVSNFSDNFKRVCERFHKKRFFNQPQENIYRQHFPTGGRQFFGVDKNGENLSSGLFGVNYVNWMKKYKVEKQPSNLGQNLKKQVSVKTVPKTFRQHVEAYKLPANQLHNATNIAVPDCQALQQDGYGYKYERDAELILPWQFWLKVIHRSVFNESIQIWKNGKYEHPKLTDEMIRNFENLNSLGHTCSTRFYFLDENNPIEGTPRQIIKFIMTNEYRHVFSNPTISGILVGLNVKDLPKKTNQTSYYGS